MAKNWHYHVVVVGSGPNGLAAAITCRRAGLSTLVLEAKGSVGGGMRSAELTEPGFLHDICSAVHPLGVASPFFRGLDLKDHGLEWIYPPYGVAHPFDDGHSALISTDLDQTSSSLGPDGPAWRALFKPFIDSWDDLAADILGPLTWPRHPLLLARFGQKAMQPALMLARRTFAGKEGPALFAGIAAHAMLPLHKAATASFGLVLGTLAHQPGWPLPLGGSQRIAQALTAYLLALGGDILTDHPVLSLDDIPPCGAVVFDLTPRQILAIAGHRFSPLYRRQLQRYRYGPGVFKLDWALREPIPFRAPGCSQAGTVHLGGTMEEITASQRTVWAGGHPDRPYVLLVQPSLFDETRAPPGLHTAWAYCHVPAASTLDMTDRVEAQIERFAPGFRDIILARHILSPAGLEAYNANYIGGDINGGTQSLCQLFTRPALRISPYRTSERDLFICSSSTPPGGGVHGMAGYHAAQEVIRRFAPPRRRTPCLASWSPARPDP